MSKGRIFVSYSHDSEEHREHVSSLSERLRQEGFEVSLDQSVCGSPAQGWPLWMLDELDACDFVLVVCSAIYYRRFRGHETGEHGYGADWEGALITQQLYEVRHRTLKFVPVFVSQPIRRDCIPEPLRAFTRYDTNDEADYRRMCQFLAGCPEGGPARARQHENRHCGAAQTAGLGEMVHDSAPRSVAVDAMDDETDPAVVARSLFHDGDDGPRSLIPYVPTRNQLVVLMLGWAMYPKRIALPQIEAAVRATAQPLASALEEILDYAWAVKNPDGTYSMTSRGKVEAERIAMACRNAGW